MEDQLIIKLFWERSEKACSELQKKHGRVCKRLIRKILKDERDVEECMDDVLLAVWDKIPPERPRSLESYVYKVAKNQAMKRQLHNTAAKRNPRYVHNVVELEKALSAFKNPERQYFSKELGECINTFLEQQKAIDRKIFVRRYWFLDSVSEIATLYGVSNNYVRVHLHRTRERLRKHLIREGMIL